MLISELADFLVCQVLKPGCLPRHVKSHHERDQNDTKASPGVHIETFSGNAHHILIRDTSDDDLIDLDTELLSFAYILIVEVSVHFGC